MGWENALFNLMLGVLATVLVVATLIFLAKRSHRAGTTPPESHADQPTSLGALLDSVLPSPMLLDGTPANPDSSTSSDGVDAVLLAYAQGALTPEAAAKELVNRLEGWALDPDRDMDQDLRAAVERELHVRGLV